MIKVYLNKKKHPTAYGCNIEDIEGYEEAILSDELYVIHHVLEWKYTAEELKTMNRYWNVTPDELIFIPKSIHSSSKYIHKGKANSLKHLNRNGHKPGTLHKMYSAFGEAFFNHYGMHQCEDRALYNREHIYWLRNHKYHWEV